MVMDINDKEKQIEELIEKMTTEEKVAQTLQLSYQSMSAEKFEETVQKGVLGSYLHVLGKDTEKYINAAKNSRLGILPMFGIDAIHGHALLRGATVFPSQLAVACTFDETLTEEIGHATAEEVAADGLDWVFSPVLCIGRDLRWGRVDETFGEDKTVVSRLGAAIIRGYQTDNLTAACAKHYLAYGEATGGRDSYDTEITERKAREIFLKPFAAAAEAGCDTFMTGYGSIDGTPLTANKRYLREILKDELGFDGFVVTDWFNYDSLIGGQRYSGNIEDAAAAGMNAGNDMSMNSPDYFEGALAAVKNGKISEATLNDSVRRILRVKQRLGLLDGSRKCPPRSVIGCEAHKKINYRAAVESAVLLENNGALPLDKKKIRKIAVIGPNADDWQAQYGDWTYVSHPDPNPAAEPTENIYTVLRGVKEEFSNAGIVYEKGCVIEEEISAAESDKLFAAAIEAAKNADVVIGVFGDNLKENGEGKDRAKLDLYGRQNELAGAVAALNKPFIGVVVSGKPLILTTLKSACGALVQCFNGGDLCGKAVAALLCGNENFSGKLPISFPYDSAALPCYYDQYEYWHGGKYIDVPAGCLYPFGYGLSYSKFSYGAPEVSQKEIRKNETFELTCEITNESKTDGEEIVQLYFRDEVCKKLTPAHTLLDFKRATVPAGETKKVTFKVAAESLGYMSDELKNTVDAGEFTLFVSGDGKNFKTTKIVVTD